MQCLNYKMLGLKLCEGISQVNAVDAVINEVMQVLSVLCSYSFLCVGRWIARVFSPPVYVLMFPFSP